MQAVKAPQAKAGSSRKLPGPDEKEPLQVRIPVSVKRKFKSHAALKGIEPHELFCEIWSFYEAALARDRSKLTHSMGQLGP